MGKFKDVGSPEFALMEECAEVIQVIAKCTEVIQVIAKCNRFGGIWDEEIPEDKTTTRWERLCSEMEDLLYQWERLKKKKAEEDVEDFVADYYKNCSEEDLASIADREEEMKYQQ